MEAFKVVTTDGTLFKANTGSKENPLDEKQANGFAALANKKAEKLGIQTRYEVIKAE